MVCKTIPEDERKSMRIGLTFLAPFFELRGTIPLHCVTAFILVAEDEGLTIGEYARRAGVSLSVMSRHLQDIGDWRRDKKEHGLELVTTRANPMNLREKEVLITDKGRSVAHKLHRALAMRS